MPYISLTPICIDVVSYYDNCMRCMQNLYVSSMIYMRF